jgi:hypothetical protein
MPILIGLLIVYPPIALAVVLLGSHWQSIIQSPLAAGMMWAGAAAAMLGLMALLRRFADGVCPPNRGEGFIRPETLYEVLQIRRRRANPEAPPIC